MCRAKSERPKGSNADEWQMFLVEHPDSSGYLAVQVAAAIEAAEDRIWSQFVSRCERLEEEADEKLGGETTEHARGFWNGQRRTAKDIRRSIEHPKYRRG